MPILLRLGTSGPPSPKKKWSGHKMQTPTFRPSSTIFRCRLHQDVQWIFIVILLENFHDLCLKKTTVENSPTDIIVFFSDVLLSKEGHQKNGQEKHDKMRWPHLLCYWYSLASPPVSCTGRYFGISRNLAKFTNIKLEVPTWNIKKCFKHGLLENVMKMSPISPIPHVQHTFQNQVGYLHQKKNSAPENRTPPMRMQMANANWMNSNLGSAVQ